MNVICLNLLAQESVNTSGGNSMGTGGSSSYSIGQVLFNTYHNTLASVSQGVQQPFEISVIGSVPPNQIINLNILAYPNPTKDLLLLEVDPQISNNSSYSLCDINGKVLNINVLGSKETMINMSEYACGIYFIRIFNDKNEIKTFKIIKN